jgi:chromosome segregation ATPase
MRKIGGLGAMFVAGLLLIPGHGWLAGRAWAQSGSEKLSEKQYQELQKKRQEQWDDLERIQQRQDNIGQRRQEAEKRQLDAEKRQREAERRLRELNR